MSDSTAHLHSAVDFCVTCYQATADRVLSPGFIEQLASRHCFPFARRVVIINNVADPSFVVSQAEARRRDGEVDAYYLVDEHLPAAFAATGLDTTALGRVSRYSTWALVAVALDGNPWILHWDVDCELVEPVDWVTPSLERLTQDSRLIVANPAWSTDEAVAESSEHDASFALGFGFSDQVFLARRRDFARPIYRERHVESLRYPLAHIARTFECRVDAYMRTHDRLRATYLGSQYRHVGETGRAYPEPTRFERCRRWVQRRRLAHSRRRG